MKQRVVTRAIIKQDDRILLIRRQGGRPSIRGLYELPGGRIHYGQQPEDALAHALKIHMSVSPESVRLKDAMSFIDPDDGQLQYIMIIFDVSLKPNDKTISLREGEYDKYAWKSLDKIQHGQLTHSTQQILGLQPVPFAPGEEPGVLELKVAENATFDHVVIYTDGGSRGNPGPSASGFVVMDSTGKKVLCDGGAYLGVSTNNVAEYQAVYLALVKAEEMGVRHADVRMDSLLVANQMNGIYRVKHNDLLPIYNRVKEIMSRFEKVTFSHVYREYNKLADGMVNKILDDVAQRNC